jgi:hypothetical protein
MKTKLLPCAILILLVLSSFNSQKESSKLLGTWQLVSYQYGDDANQTVPESLQYIKIISTTHFTWVHFAAKDKLVFDIAGGRYTFDGENYIETIEFGGSAMLSYVGKDQTFKIKLEGGKMYLSGSLSDNLKIAEV